jgi:hypothetical protein
MCGKPDRFPRLVRSAEARTRRAAAGAAVGETGLGRGSKSDDAAEPRESLLYFTPTAVGAHFGLVLEKAENEDLKILAASTALQIV